MRHRQDDHRHVSGPMQRASHGRSPYFFCIEGDEVVGGRARREAAGSAPFEFLFGQRGRRQIERRHPDRRALQKFAFADDDDVFIASQAGGDFDPTPVADARLHRNRHGLGLFDDENGFTLLRADHRLGGHYQSLWNLPQSERYLGEGAGPERVVGVGEVDFNQQAAGCRIKRKGRASDGAGKRSRGQFRDLDRGCGLAGNNPGAVVLWHIGIDADGVEVHDREERECRGG